MQYSFFIGISQYVNAENFSDHVIDKETFYMEGNKSLFDNIWFTKVFH